MDLRYKTLDTEVHPVANARRMRFLVSTAGVDRDNDTIDPKGWVLDNYLKNPVVAFAHDYRSLPVAKCLAIGPTDKGLEAEVEFPVAGLYAFADTVYDMLKTGFLNATSVGFRPMEFEPNQERKGYDYKKQELTEFSIVPVPSNPEALVQQRGITTEKVEEYKKAMREWATGPDHKETPPNGTQVLDYGAIVKAVLEVQEKTLKPMPTPNQGESQTDFMHRCMGDSTMMDDYKEQDQRTAVCMSQWRRKKEPDETPPPANHVVDLTDGDVDGVTVEEGDLQEALRQVGPELAETIANNTRMALNRALGRID